jgi:hypothetical protein
MSVIVIFGHHSGAEIHGSARINARALQTRSRTEQPGDVPLRPEQREHGGSATGQAHSHRPEMLERVSDSCQPGFNPDYPGFEIVHDVLRKRLDIAMMYGFFKDTKFMDRPRQAGG